MEVYGEQGIGSRTISEDLHGEEGKWVGGSEKVNEFPLRCVQPEVFQGHLLWLPVGCVDLAPERQSWARGRAWGGIKAQKQLER